VLRTLQTAETPVARTGENNRVWAGGASAGRLYVTWKDVFGFSYVEELRENITKRTNLVNAGVPAVSEGGVRGENLGSM